MTSDFQRGFQFNTAIAAIMELVNEAYRLKDASTATRRDRRGALCNGERRLLDLPLRAPSGGGGLGADKWGAGVGESLAAR